VSGGASVHPDSQYDVSTVSNTPDTSHTDHITDFNNKFRHFHPEMMTEAGPGSEAPEVIFPNNNPPCGPGYCTGGGSPPPSGYPLLHLPSLPQHHLAGKLLRDVYIHYNITTNTLGLGCTSCHQSGVRSESLQYPGHQPPEPQLSHLRPPSEPPVTSKLPRPRPGPPQPLYNSEVIQQLRSSDNLVCDV